MRIAVLAALVVGVSPAVAKPKLSDYRSRRVVSTKNNGLIGLQVSGALSSSKIRPELSKLHARFGGCKSKGEWGFALSFSIMASGQVVGLKVGGIEDRQTRACVLGIAGTIKSTVFDAGVRPTSVESRWRFGFVPKAQPVSKCHQGVCIDRVRVGSKRLDRDDIAKTLSGRRYYLGKCIQEAKRRYTASVSSNRHGRVTRAVVRGKSMKARKCLEGQLRSLSLPATMKRERVRLRVWREQDRNEGVVGGVVGGSIYGRRLQVGAVSALGGLSSTIVLRDLRRQQIRLQRCIRRKPRVYRKHYRPKNARGKSGVIRHRRRLRPPPRRYPYRLKVLPSGRVGTVSIKGLSGSSKRCMTKVLRSIRFPKAKKRTQVTGKLYYR